MPESIENTPLAEDAAAHGTALVAIDMPSDRCVPDGDTPLRGAERIAPRIAALEALHDDRVIAPADAIATLGNARAAAALEHQRDVLGAETNATERDPGADR